MVLALITFALYWPAMDNGFLNYDDDIYITANTHIQRGLTWDNVEWAFFNAERYIGYWHPITMLSHMADCHLFGLKPWGHHLTSVLLHSLNTALVFWFLYAATTAFWRSVIAAAFFGWHPLHVESVAWIAERKDVLSTFFGLLALIFYVAYVRKSCARARPRQDSVTRSILSSLSSKNHWLVCLFFVLSLMSKPMLVTMPFVMLLLDYWPFERFKPGNTIRVLVEKIPFFLVVTATSAAAYVVQEREGALSAGANLPLGARAGNALVSYCRYLGKFFWPTDLTVFYPHPGFWPTSSVVLAGVLICVISLFFFLLRKCFPPLLIGWLFFVGTMVPVSGIVQVGAHAMADRYTYVPFIGLFITLVWGAVELLKRWKIVGIVTSAAGLALLTACWLLTRQQIAHWKNSETLFRHALETKDNYVAHKGLADALNESGRIDEAIAEYAEAIHLSPKYYSAYNNLGNVYLRLGQLDAAILNLQTAASLNPQSAEAHYNLGNAYLKKRAINDAVLQYRESIRLKPNHPDSHFNLGIALFNLGDVDGSIAGFTAALRTKPDYAEAHNYLGLAFAKRNKPDEAIKHFREATRLKPDYAAAFKNCGDALRSKGHIENAIIQYREAVRLKPDFLEARKNLADLETTNRTENVSQPR